MEYNNTEMFPCKCILHLSLSSLRKAYDITCEFLNQRGWDVLCRHFESQHMLTNDDVLAITCASRLRTPSPTQEMLLRLEKKRVRLNQEFRFTIEMFLQHVYTILSTEDYKYLNSIFVNLHDPSCPVVSLVTSSETMLAQIPYPMLIPFPVPTSLQNIQHVEMHHRDLPLSFEPNSANSSTDQVEPYYLRVTKHPADTVISLQDELILRCLAESNEEISYSWKKDGRLLPGMNNKLLMLHDLELTDGGDYQCIAMTQHHQVESKMAKVKIRRNSSDEAQNSVSPSTPQSINDSLYFATDKLALLIANENYAHNPRLESAGNDVNALAQTLRDKLNFKTVALVNLNFYEMVRAVQLFCRQLNDGAYCVTYLAGHGFENDGQCYIVPTDAPENYDSRNCFSVQKLIHDIRKSCDLSLSVFLLDVCRKRNKNAVRLAEPDHEIKSGNYVISFATMEHGMAYEVKGRDLGVYVTSLQKYLDKDKRITRVLELVHRDIHKNCVTRGSQQPEFKSNMFEDRKLGDPINSNSSNAWSSLTEWISLHVSWKPTLFVFESCGVEVELHKYYMFSNVMSVEVKIRDKGLVEWCEVSIALRRPHQSTGAIQATVNRTRFEIENLQRMAGNILHFTLFLSYRFKSNGDVFHEEWDDSIAISFVSWWNF